jgi:hypothetical protein
VCGSDGATSLNGCCDWRRSYHDRRRFFLGAVFLRVHNCVPVGRRGLRIQVQNQDATTFLSSRAAARLTTVVVFPDPPF